MKKKSLIIVITITIISFLFNIYTIFFMINHNCTACFKLNIVSISMIISVSLNIFNILYLIINLKSDFIRRITKKRILFNIIFIIILFILLNIILNRQVSIYYILSFLSFILSLSNLYYLLSLYSNKLEINYKLLKLKKLASYIKEQKKSNIILVDTPTHSNLGDAAIALAEKKFLEEELKNNSIIEVTAQDIEGMEKYYALFTKKNKLILVHGGGFLGDIWPSEEKRFRRIIKSFYKNKIIVFPQTVHYDFSKKGSQEFFNKSKKIYSSHKNLTIFAREQKSYEFLKNNYPNNQIYIVPDIVARLKIDNMNFNRKNILLCMRSDIEKTVKEEEQNVIVDKIKKKYPNEIIKRTDTVINKNILPDDREHEVNLKLQEFAKCKLVITDRLHGMVFAAITNTPCIALGNSSGKVKGVYEWIKENEYVYYLDNISDISKVLNKLDINKKYKYQIKKVEEKFKPLKEEIKKEINYGSK